MTKVDLVTGFLGVGKTTFIKKYADYLASIGEKVHIIENEFGGVAIDANTLRDEDCDVSQITGGCMCCSGRVSFQNLLLKAASSGYDRILVEPSGIYDVNEFFNVLLTPPVNSSCVIGNVITIADSKADDILSYEARYLMFSQLIFTGCVVMSKTQLNSAKSLNTAIDELQKMLSEHGSQRDLRAEDIIVTKPWDELTSDDFKAISSCGYRIVEHAHEIIDHMTVFTAIMYAGKFDTRENLDNILHDLLNTEKYGKIYRIKGYISDINGVWYELNCSADGCFVEPASVKRGVFLVIGQNFDEKAVEDLFINRKAR